MLSCNSHKHISPSTRFVVNTPKPTRDGTRCTYRLLEWKEDENLALEPEIGKAKTERERESVRRGRGNPYPLIKAANIKRLLTRLRIRLFPRAV